MSDQRLNILWLSHLIPYPPKGGVLMRAYYLIRELARHHNVDLLAFNQRSLLSTYFEDTAKGLAEARDHLGSFVRSLEFFEIPSERSLLKKHWTAVGSLFTEDPYTINWLRSREYDLAVRRAVRDHHYDAVHFDTISLAPFRSDDITIPCVLDHHNVESHMMIRRAAHTANPMLRWYFHQEGQRIVEYERAQSTAFPYQIVCSEHDRQRLSGHVTGAEISVIPNAVVVPHSPPRQALGAPRLLFVGGLSWYPNRDAMHYFLQDVWPLVKQDVPECSIDLVGERPSQLIRRIAGRDQAVRVHGYVEDIARFYEFASVYVCPIRDGGGTKLKLLDAMAHRMPIVAHPRACEGLDVRDGEHLLVAETPKEMALAIRRLIEQPQEAVRLQENGYRLVRERYDAGAIGSELARLFTRVSERREAAGGALTPVRSP
jgi:polysaccharide biosynthesis protein PslH